jgi:hypothetical protein
MCGFCRFFCRKHRSGSWQWSLLQRPAIAAHCTLHKADEVDLILFVWVGLSRFRSFFFRSPDQHKKTDDQTSTELSTLMMVTLYFLFAKANDSIHN